MSEQQQPKRTYISRESTLVSVGRRSPPWLSQGKEKAALIGGGDEVKRYAVTGYYITIYSG